MTLLPAASAGASFQGAEHERRIPGGDDHRRAGGHALHLVPHALGIPGAVLVLGDQVGISAEVERPPSHQPLFHGLIEKAHVQGLHQGDVVVVGLDQIGQSVERVGPVFNAEGAPSFEALHRGGHRGVRRGIVAPSDVGQVLPLHGRAGLEPLRRGHPRSPQSNGRPAPTPRRRPGGSPCQSSPRHSSSTVDS